MKKLKLFALSASLVGLTSLGLSYFGTNNAKAQDKMVYCQWDDEGCPTPVETNLCGCETQPGEQVQ